MSVKSEIPLDELTVQVWLLYDSPNFRDGRTDDPNTRCPLRTFQAGGIKIINHHFVQEQ